MTIQSMNYTVSFFINLRNKLIVAKTKLENIGIQIMVNRSNSLIQLGKVKATSFMA